MNLAGGSVPQAMEQNLAFPGEGLYMPRGLIRSRPRYLDLVEFVEPW